MRRKTTIFVVAFLLAILCGCTGGDMLAELERLEEQNRIDQPFTSDSAARRIVDYYDRWYRLPTAANRNLQMRAYYMLGSAYRDMGEALAALHYYNIATQQPDTNNIDSTNAATLFRIYGQMAMIYEQQNLPFEELEAISLFSKYALLAKDTASYILGYTRMTVPYYMIDDTANVIRISEKAYRIYREYGLYEDAAQVYPVAIYVSLKNGNYPRARKFMDIFENESGLFDEQGNIESGREQYYENKGLYYIGIQQLDSAEYYFRKLLFFGYEYEAYQGLLSLFQIKKQSDSIASYASRFENVTNKWLTQRQTDAIIQTSAMYKYERNQNQAMVNAQKANRYRRLMYWGIAITLLIIIFTYRLYTQYRKKQEKKLHQLNNAYLKALGEYEQLVKEHRILKESYEHSKLSSEAQELIESKQVRIEELEQELKTYQTHLNTLKYAERETLLMDNDITKYFVKKKHITPNWQFPKEERWIELTKVYAQYMPIAAACMDKAELSRQERLTCILTHMDFTSGDIATLLNTSASRISNAKKDASKKLFKDGDVSLLRRRIIESETKNKSIL